MGIIEINITQNIKKERERERDREREREREERILQMSEKANELMRIHSKPRFN